MTKLIKIGLLLLSCQGINLDTYSDTSSTIYSVRDIPVFPNKDEDCNATSCDRKKKSPGSSMLL